MISLSTFKSFACVRPRVCPYVCVGGRRDRERDRECLGERACGRALLVKIQYESGVLLQICDFPVGFPLGFPFNQFYKIAIMSINQHDWGVSIISINHRYICLVQGCQHYPTLCLCANSQLPENQGNHWLALREKLQKQQRKSVTFSDAKKGTQMGTDVVEAPWASRRKPKPFAHRGG